MKHKFYYKKVAP